MLVFCCSNTVGQIHRMLFIPEIQITTTTLGRERVSHLWTDIIWIKLIVQVCYHSERIILTHFQRGMIVTMIVECFLGTFSTSWYMLPVMKGLAPFKMGYCCDNVHVGIYAWPSNNYQQILRFYIWIRKFGQNHVKSIIVLFKNTAKHLSVLK